MEEKIKQAISLITEERNYMRRGLTMNYEDVDTMDNAVKLLNEVLKEC